MHEMGHRHPRAKANRIRLYATQLFVMQTAAVTALDFSKALMLGYPTCPFHSL